ncbi:MAG: 2-C-methyl-D-erythritol 2,4-cyclodiphosphate synthase [Deltaproteobacteria bacterium]|nr:2-C-methyl-D-erythritol 2,4-cyclodiphosphate synthase [Deltaproteobacteria bacterium]
MTAKTGVIVAAAGRGERFGSPRGFPKPLALLGGKPLLRRALETFWGIAEIAETVVAVPGDLLGVFKDALGPLPPQAKLVAGGESRGESVAKAFAALGRDVTLVMAHDGARPLVKAADVLATRAAALEGGAAVLALPARETVKEAREARGGEAPRRYPLIARTVPRERLYLAQTPQAFRRDIFEKCLQAPPELRREATDEAFLAEALGYGVLLVPGSARNVKITAREDLELAEALLRGESAGGPRAARAGLAVGEGWDFHAFAADARPLFLGCVAIPGERGLLGHSDADVLTHALIDALLGAAGLGDIGTHFPPGDPAYRGAAGESLLRQTVARLAGRWDVLNVDLTLIGEKPKIFPHRAEIAQTLASILNVAPDRVNVKGKTTEKMGFLGRGEGLAAVATALHPRVGE